MVPAFFGLSADRIRHFFHVIASCVFRATSSGDVSTVGKSCQGKNGTFFGNFCKKTAPEPWKKLRGRVGAKRAANGCPMRPSVPCSDPHADGTCACLERDGGRADGAAYAAPSPARCARGRRDKHTSLPTRDNGERKTSGAPSLNRSVGAPRIFVFHENRSFKPFSDPHRLNARSRHGRRCPCIPRPEST